MFHLFDVLLILFLVSAGALPLIAGGGELALRLSGKEAARDRLWAALFFAGAAIAILGTLASLLAATIGWGL